ncbi:MAG TPA: 6-phosphogluconolactonase [Methylomirabilota bacterium]|jgi:6-phosphogluconolactonase|nr:6-phosphogluconolactonase [Methylomirabilota bacterium]
MSEVRRFDDAEALSRAAADEFVELGREALSRQGRFCVALSGGSTPRRLYELLTEDARRSLAWSRVEVFWGDERAVPPDHPESNYGTAAGLLDRLGVPPARRHRIRGECPDLNEAAREYQEEIARVFGVPSGGPPPAFDLILLGMGADGHTASLFPYSEALPERRRWVLGHFVARLEANRITLTPPILNRARQIRLLVVGADKAAALREVIEGPRDPERLPAQLVAPESGRLVWLVDRAAAAELRGAP